MRVIACGLCVFLLVGIALAQTSSDGTSTDAQTSAAPGDLNNSPAPADLTGTPPWVTWVRVAATIGPWLILAVAILGGFILHSWLVLREQRRFPDTRGSRLPQVMPAVVGGVLFVLLGALFVFFEVRARADVLAQRAGVVDQWRPVSGRAAISWLICMALAVGFWFVVTRRADRYYPGKREGNA